MSASNRALGHLRRSRIDFGNVAPTEKRRAAGLNHAGCVVRPPPSLHGLGKMRAVRGTGGGRGRGLSLATATDQPPEIVNSASPPIWQYRCTSRYIRRIRGRTKECLVFEGPRNAFQRRPRQVTFGTRRSEDPPANCVVDNASRLDALDDLTGDKSARDAPSTAAE